MSLPKKRKWLAILCRPEVLDRMDLIDMWTSDPSTFTSQQTALWNALDAVIDTAENDSLTASSVNTPVTNMMTAMAAI